MQGWLPLPPGWRVVSDPFNVGSHACLPSILRDQFYQGLSSRLAFILMVREPLSRTLSSYFYYASTQLRKKTHVDFKFLTSKRQVETYFRMAIPAQATGFYDLHLWGSMYARQLEDYLAKFAATQFVVSPYLLYARHKGSLLHELSLRLGIDLLQCQNDDPGRMENAHAHKSPEEILSNRTREAFQVMMEPEVDRLVTLLANASQRGLGLHAYNGTLGSKEETRKWLVEG